MAENSAKQSFACPSHKNFFLISMSHKLHLRNVWLVNSQKAEAYVVQGKGQESGTQ